MMFAGEPFDRRVFEDAAHDAAHRVLGQQIVTDMINSHLVPRGTSSKSGT